MIKSKPLWRSTPPAIFPVALGFMGLALAWRNMADVFPVSHVIGDLMLGMSTAFFLFFAISYVIKVLARPTVVFDDLKVPAARAGVAAFPMAIMLMAAALLPLHARVNEVWWVGVIFYYIATGLVAWSILKGPPEARRFSPFQYLAFVGPIVGPIAGIPLGYILESQILAVAAFIPFVAITLGYYPKLLKVRPPVPLRPSVAIVLAPVSLFGLATGGLGIDWAYHFFYWFAIAIALALISVSLWLTEGGWNPVWGAFTFPLSAFINLQIFAVTHGGGIVAKGALFSGLVIGTPLILYIVWKAGQSWIRRELPKKTAAAIA